MDTERLGCDAVISNRWATQLATSLRMPAVKRKEDVYVQENINCQQRGNSR